MMEEKITTGRRYVVYQPNVLGKRDELWPLVLIHGDEKMAELLQENQLLPMKNCLAVMILSENRLDDYTPWTAKALNARFPDFGGKADNYIDWIRNNLLPELQNTFPVRTQAQMVGILGQSLGGLLNMYLYCSDASFWNYAACVSPSVWYPGFLEYFQKAISAGEPKRWFILSGTQEGAGHHDIKKDTVSNTRYIQKLLSEYGHDIEVMWDEGGHHDNLAERYKRALSWLDNRLL